MIKRAEIAQRLEELRREDQSDETGKQRDAASPGAEMEFAEIGKAEVNRDHRNRQRREKLQYGGGEKGEAQHFHGALAKIGGGGGDSGGFRFGAMKQAQGLASAQPVEEIAAEARQRDKVAAVGVSRAHADQRHKQRDQRRGA